MVALIIRIVKFFLFKCMCKSSTLAFAVNQHYHSGILRLPVVRCHVLMAGGVIMRSPKKHTFMVYKSLNVTER